MSAEHTADQGGGWRPVRALEARRIVDLLTLRLAPSVAAGLIAFSHLREVGLALLVFGAVLVAMQAIGWARLPLQLIPGARLLLCLAAPVAGAAAAWLIAVAAGTVYPPGAYEAIVLGAWLVLALGLWIKARLTEGMRARVAVVGPGDFAGDLAGELADDRFASYEVVGWVGVGGPPKQREQRDLRWLGELADIRAAVLEEGIELLICAAEAADGDGDGLGDVLERVADECLDLPVRLITANQLYEETLGHVPVGTIDAAWYRYILHPRYRAFGPTSKRIFDLLVGTALGLLALPLLALAAVAVRLEGPGPIRYRQPRLGENGRWFQIVKLRTMRVDAEASGPQLSRANDERVTRVGRILRRSHLDELPQLWNVLRGEMTLVGPRPERPEIVAELERRFPHYTRRQIIKPGITGWAQLRCGYASSELGTAWKLSHDLFYIKRRSVLGDALILAETGFVVFRDAHRALRSPRERFLLREEGGD
jgi:exopolysaccharide biosynthesis polyprenyl glycosylphosphotransferase